MTKEEAAPIWRDIRGIGFTERTSLARAWEWLDSDQFLPDRTTVPSSQAIGRFLAESEILGNLPRAARSAFDGFAVRAAETAGAGIYNPMSLIVSDTMSAGCAVSIAAGAPLPAGADAVLPYSAVTRTGPERIEVIVEAVPGEGVAAAGSWIHGRERPAMLSWGRVLRPQDAALLAIAGRRSVSVHVRPEVRLVIAGPKNGDAEALEPMLRALVVRDGGVPSGGIVTSLAAGMADARKADIILVAGRSGPGEDDIAALAVVEAGGVIAMHGMAMRPGGSSGLARLPGKGRWQARGAVLLLPGEPLDCLVAYDMLAGRLIRRLAGFSRELPYPHCTLPLGRKIVSAIGSTDVVPVVVDGDKAVPVAGADSGNLAASCRADGFVVVPEEREGYREGSSVFVWLYDIFGRYLYYWP